MSPSVHAARGDLALVCHLPAASRQGESLFRSLNGAEVSIMRTATAKWLLPYQRYIQALRALHKNALHFNRQHPIQRGHDIMVWRPSTRDTRGRRPPQAPLATASPAAC